MGNSASFKQILYRTFLQCRSRQNLRFVKVWYMLVSDKFLLWWIVFKYGKSKSYIFKALILFFQNLSKIAFSIFYSHTKHYNESRPLKIVQTLWHTLLYICTDTLTYWRFGLENMEIKCIVYETCWYYWWLGIGKIGTTQISTHI